MFRTKMEKGNTVHFVAIESECVSDDAIEIVYEHCEDNVKKQTPRKPRKSILDDLKIFQDAIARKKFTRWIMVLGGIFIFLSGILLIVTLNMSKDIDDKVRDSNVLLRQQSNNKVKPMTGISNSTIT